MNANDLKQAFAELPPLEVKTPWDEHRAALRKHVANDDPAEFLRWSTIQATMFVGNAPYIRGEYDELPVKWYGALEEPGFGKPFYIPWVQFKTSGNLIHQAYHLHQWVDKSGVSASDLSHIVEVGGGYGAMALLCERLGFDGLYGALDFSEFLLLQEYYLKNLDRVRYGMFWSGWSSVHYQPDDICRRDLFIALFSLSEMPIAEREKYLAIQADNYLIAYQPDWGGVDNAAFFAEFTESKPEHQWWDYVNPHFSNYRYLVGARK